MHIKKLCFIFDLIININHYSMNEEKSKKSTFIYKGVKPFRNLAIIRVTTKIDPFTAHTIANHPNKLDDSARSKIKRTYTVVGTGKDCLDVKVGDLVQMNAEFFSRPTVEYYRVIKLEVNGLIDYLGTIKGNQLTITQEQAAKKMDKHGIMTFDDYYFVPEYEIYGSVGIVDDKTMADIFNECVIIDN